MAPVRAADCLACKYGRMYEQMTTLVAVAEALSLRVHHHHVVRCQSCGGAWFDDLLWSPGLGVPVPSRRDSVMCRCPEDDGTERYRSDLMVVTVSEDRCTCGPGDLVMPAGEAA
jgi:hypothetical protein